MKIKIKTYANLGSLDDEIEIKENSRIGELLDKLKISNKEIFVVLVNGEKCNVDSVLKENDSVSLFPYIGGG